MLWTPPGGFSTVAPTAEILIVSSPIRLGRESLDMAQDTYPSNFLAWYTALFM